MKIKTTKDRRTRIGLRQRKRISGTGERPRLRVFRSVSHIYAQVIDDLSGTTVAAAASTEPGLKDVFAGTTRGGLDILNQNQGTNLSASVSGILVNGATTYIRLWSFVGGSVTSIARFGLKEGPNALKPGDPITVTCTPAADGKSPVGLLVAITYADGHTVRFRGVDE